MQLGLRVFNLNLTTSTRSTKISPKGVIIVIIKSKQLSAIRVRSISCRASTKVSLLALVVSSLVKYSLRRFFGSAAPIEKGGFEILD